MNPDIQAGNAASGRHGRAFSQKRKTRDKHGDRIYYYNRGEAALLIRIYKSVSKESNIQCNLLAYFTALARSIYM